MTDHYYVEDHEDGPLRANGAGGYPRTDKQPLLIAAPLTSGGHPNSNMPGRRKEDDVNLVAGPLGGGNDGIGRRSEDDPNLAVYPLARRGREGGSELEVGDEGVYNALRAGDGGSSRLNQVMIGTGVRRLTPTECERLQALPDGWTNPTEDAPDSRRYSALGDAVTATVAQWIGHRLMAHLEDAARPAKTAQERPTLKEAGSGSDAP